uniref:Putative ovule protein n=1 Tax=Solanum chacoense TaxID=4108 RepID=A0A0V0GUQ2_SOLCH
MTLEQCGIPCFFWINEHHPTLSYLAHTLFDNDFEMPIVLSYTKYILSVIYIMLKRPLYIVARRVSIIPDRILSFRTTIESIKQLDLAKSFTFWTTYCDF